ncbi:MAG: RNA polymerase subunit sigma-24 [Chlorobiaceae bacterium]|nr:RNA polymerase subunit sigma-24 [Chlorobiaceae bacterium]
MIEIKKTPLDLIDDIYNLAYWMTGNEKASTDLVSHTCLNTDMQAPETEVLRTFRDCYLDTYGQNSDLEIHDISGTQGNLINSLKQWAADIKLSVLLSELTGLRHSQIADILGKPVDTIRLWLFWGRKFMAHDYFLRASA